MFGFTRTAFGHHLIALFWLACVFIGTGIARLDTDAAVSSNTGLFDRFNSSKTRDLVRNSDVAKRAGGLSGTLCMTFPTIEIRANHNKAPTIVRSPGHLSLLLRTLLQR